MNKERSAESRPSIEYGNRIFPPREEILNVVSVTLIGRQRHRRLEYLSISRRMRQELRRAVKCPLTQELGAIGIPEFDLDIGKVSAAFVLKFDVAELEILNWRIVPQDVDSPDLRVRACNRDPVVPRGPSKYRESTEIAMPELSYQSADTERDRRRNRVPETTKKFCKVHVAAAALKLLVCRILQKFHERRIGEHKLNPPSYLGPASPDQRDIINV